MSGLRYGIRRVLAKEPFPVVEEICRTVRELLEHATEHSPDLKWETFTAGIYRENGNDNGRLIVDVEIEEEQP